MRTALVIATALALAGCATMPGGDREAPVGAAARAKHGPDPVARPPEDVGSAEDPAPALATPKP